MKITTPYTCDFCNALKGTLSYWFMLAVTGSDFRLIAWDDKLADTHKHVCPACTHKALAQWEAAA